MILTGDSIGKEVKLGNIVIEPFNEQFLEPNSYGFHLGDDIIEICDGEQNIIDIKESNVHRHHKIGEEGFVLEPGKFYLGSTAEKMGSYTYAKTLLADFSVASMGVWIQFSAPLGHVGAVINWTLEIAVTQPVRIYPYMKIGKLAFWKTYGDIISYGGKYVGSDCAVESRIYAEYERGK